MSSASASISVTFPDDLANKIIWTPIINDNGDNAPLTPTDTAADAPTTEDAPVSSTDISIPKFTFAESIIGEAQAAIAHGLSPSVQMGIVKTFNSHLEDKKDKNIKEPLINVLYPHNGCHEIIDAAIRAMAQDEEADVLVIDSLELALGEFGVFGKGAADLLSAFYNEPVIPDEDEEEDKEDSANKESKSEEKNASDSSKESAKKESEGKDASDSASEASSFEVVSDDKPDSHVTPMSSGKLEEVEEETKDGEKKDGEANEEENMDERKKEENMDDKKEEGKEEGKELTDEEKEKEEKCKQEEEEEKEKRKQERIDNEKARIDRELQDVFDKLVSLPPVDKEPTKSRIIYWRDFSNIAHSASPILIRLFRAMHARRTANFSKGSMFKDLLQPTILVLGHSKWFAAGKYSYKYLRDTFARGDTALTKLLPYIWEDAVTLDGDAFFLSTELPVPSQTFFLTALSTDGEGLSQIESCSTPFNAKFELSEFDISGSTIAVFPEGSVKKEFSKVEERLAWERRKTVANAWLKVALAQCGGVVAPGLDVLGVFGDDKDVDAYLVKEEKREKEKLLKKTVEYDSDDDDDAKKKKDEEKKEKEKETKEHIPKCSRILDLLVKHTSSPLPVALERFVTAAFAIAPRPVEEGSVEVEIVTFAKAYISIIQAVKVRNAWWRRNKMMYQWYYGYNSDSDDGDEEDEKDEKEKDEKEEDEKGKDEKENDEKENDEKEDPIVKKVRNAGDLSEHESRLLSCVVDTGELDTSFDDACISESTVETLRTIVSMPLLFPSAFKSGILSREAIGGVLLYGPPGTGKTLVCRAVAKECGARMLAIKPSDIMNIWLGESEKSVNAVFTLAYRLAPCLIFIDELDSLFRKRQNGDQKWTRDILAEFLQSMDGLQSAKKNKEAGVIVIGATNRPYDIDDAVLRRLPSRMFVDVPSEEEREKILKLHLRGETLDEGLNLTDIARKTFNYSGSDLKNLCVSAAMMSVKEALGTFSWKVNKRKTEDKKYGKDQEKKDEKDMEKKDDKEGEEKDEEKKEDDEANQETDAARERVSKRTVNMSHFVQAMIEVPASSTSGSHSELRRWHEQFGKKSPVSTKTSYGGGGSSTSTSRYSGYGSSAAGTGAGSTSLYGGYGSGESGSTPRYGASTSDSSTSTNTPRYDSYGAGAGATTPAAGTTLGESTTPRYGSSGFSASSYLSGLGKGSAATGSTGGYTPGASLAKYGAGGSYKYGAAAAPAVEEKSSASVEEAMEPKQAVAPELDSGQKQKDGEDEEANS